MGSPEEVAAAPDMDSSSTKETSINMDLYIDPVKERKMMLKFDVRLPPILTNPADCVFSSVQLACWDYFT
jgi:hypothetical protein